MADPRFIHLRVHSDYSMIDGLAKTGPLVKKVASLGMPAFAITDFTNLCGLVKFYGAAHSAGIKPIIGADVYLETELLGDEYAHLTILARNNVGYQNLTLLISEAYKHGYGAAGPIIKQEWLTTYKEGLLLLSGGRMGDVGKFLLRENRTLVDQCLEYYQTHFPDSYYLELIRTGRPDEESYLHKAVTLASEKGLPVLQQMTSVFLIVMTLMHMKFVLQFMMDLRSPIPNDLKIIVRSNICAQKKKCVNYLLIYQRHWKTALK